MLVLSVPASIKPLVTVLAACVFGVIALLRASSSPVPLTRAARSVIAALGVGLAGLLVGTGLSAAPAVSFLGVVGQHNGWLLWAVMGLWFVLGTQTVRGRSWRSLIWSVAVLGSVFASLGLLDVAGVLNGATYSTEISGVLESSVSLGQIMLLGIGAGVVCGMAERQPNARRVAWVLVALQVASLALSSARAAQCAACAGALVAALWMYENRMGALVGRVVWAVVGLAALGAVASIGVIACIGPAGLPDAIATPLNMRPVLWHSAWTLLPDRLLIGAGPDQFSSVFDASIAGGYLQRQTSGSPHNVILGWTLGGGLVAALGMCAAFLLAGRGVVRRLGDHVHPARVLAVALAAWAASLLGSWTDPLGAVIAAVLAGALLVDDEVPGLQRPALVGLASSLLVPLIVVLAFGLRLLALEYRWEYLREVENPDPAGLVGCWEDWADPAFGGGALSMALAGLPATADTAGILATDALERTPWDANAALIAVELAAALDYAHPDVPHPSVAEAIEAGRRADPASPIWDELGGFIPTQ